VVPFSELVYRGEKYPHIVEVGATLPNPWGLYEVLGNVAEWCLDEWRRYPKDSDTPTVDRFHEGDPTRAGFVVRGSGFWNSEVEPTVFARTARHDVRGGFRGFRVVLAPTINLRYGKSDAD
jgi:formylglycine-generating enzyme required for sulfatase activity